MADLTTGANAEGYEAFCDDIYNALKNSWRQADPCTNLAGLEAGMVVNNSVDNRLYLALLISGCDCSEILQSCIPLTDDVEHGYGTDFNVSIYYDEAGNDELMIEAANRADTEGVTVSLLETNQRFRIRQNGDYISFFHDGTNPYMRWSNDVGSDFFVFRPDGVLADIRGRMYLRPKGNPTNPETTFELWDNNGINIRLRADHNKGILQSQGNLDLDFQYDDACDIKCWSAIPAGNPDFYWYGYITTGAAIRYTRVRMDDTNDEFEIEAENNANHEGITALIQEANQRFRVRGAARAERFWIDEDGLIGLMRQGELFMWPYQGDLADDGTFNLPAFTDGCMGFIQAGNNEEYAIFSVDDDGDVTLLVNSANVSANADNDGDLCIGTAATQEPLVIKNRLGATKNINLIMWYS